MIQRVGAAFVIGALITLSLFWLMQFMILHSAIGLEPTDDLKMVEFVRLKRDPTLKTRKRKPPEKPPLKKRPPPPKVSTPSRKVVRSPTPRVSVPNLDFPALNPRLNGPLVSGLQAEAEVVSTPAPVSDPAPAGEVSTNLVPVFRVKPKYPRRAARRRIEGWVKVEFTITAAGTVKDAEVVESRPGSIFNREALKAIARWKFKPKMVSGKPVEQRAVQVLEFRMGR